MHTVDYMPSRTLMERELALSHGFTVVANDGPMGEVETPIFPPDSNEPDYLVVRIGSRPFARRPVISTALVDFVDGPRQLVFLRGKASELSCLPEHLPLAI